MAEQEKYDVFISYSRNDYVDKEGNIIPNNDVSKIKNALSDANISYWFDEEGIYSGNEFTEKIVTNIEASKIFLFLSTKDSNLSQWTSKEIACADEFGKYIIPVRIDKTPYNKKVMFRIADLSYVDYEKNPSKGLIEIIHSVKAFLQDLKISEEQKLAEEQRRREDIERQRRQQEEEKKRQAEIEKVEVEISALESQRIEREKTVLQKEQELKLAQIDLKACESKIQKLQTRLKELRNSKTEKKIDNIGRIIKESNTDKPNKEESQIIPEKNNESNKKKILQLKIDGISFKMIPVPGGSGNYYIGETQVTQELWETVMKKNPSYFEGAKHPVESVSWDDCQKFIKKLNTITKKQFRLPTEAEWEYAAKGGSMTHGYRYAGSNDIEEVAWYDQNSFFCGTDRCSNTHPDYGTHEVKTKKPNELGLYDMSGNVWEWCEDRLDASDSHRVYRGGCWFNNERSCEVTSRFYDLPDSRSYKRGLRLVLSIK